MLREEGDVKKLPSFFDNKCKEFIEGYRFIPENQVWIREDGIKFKGEMIAPWDDLDKLIKYQLIMKKNRLKLL